MKLKIFDLYQYDTVHNILSYTLKFLDLKFTDYKLRESIDSHLDASSLSSVKDILSDYGIQSTVIRKGKYSYEDFQTPFICLIKKDDWDENNFTIVTKVEDGIVEFLDTNKNQLDILKVEEFDRIDEKIILLIDDTEKKNEHGYDLNRKNGIKSTFSILAPFVIIFVMVLYNLIFRNNYFVDDVIQKSLYLFFFCVGSLISALLLWQEVDSENPFFKKVCGGASAKKTNCNIVLSSAGSKFLNVSWTIWGFSYFFTLFVSHLLFFNNTTTVLCAVASLVVSPYIVYSIYYQLKVIKKWCILCIMVQFILGINLLLGAILRYKFAIDFHWDVIGVILLLGVLIVFLFNYASAVLKNERKGKLIDKRWRKLRYNELIFNTLLQQQPKIIMKTDDLGIVIGNPEASIEIIKVCNPYCRPCAIANKEITKLLATNKHIKLRLIFNATGALNDRNTLPVIHFLGIEDKLGKDKVHEAINEWFISEPKNYKDFASKYHIEGDASHYLTRTKMMNEWCNRMSIKATPSFFINGHQLPEEYSFDDFRYLF